MGYGDFTGWMCGCGAKVTELNGPLPDEWRIVWPKSKDKDGFDLEDATPRPGIYCPSCWDRIPGTANPTAKIDTTGKPYRKALMGHGKRHRMAHDLQLRTCERLAVGKRWADVKGKRDQGLRELIGSGLHHRCFPSGAPPDLPQAAMVIHPSAMASGLLGGLYDYLGALAARYEREVHLFWDESRWYVVFIADYPDDDDDASFDFCGYNTGCCEFWLALYPDGTSKILGAS